MNVTHSVKTRLILRHDTYKNFKKHNPVLFEGELVVVTDIPWHKSWFGLCRTRLKYGVGKPFNKTRFL